MTLGQVTKKFGIFLWRILYKKISLNGFWHAFTWIIMKKQQKKAEDDYDKLCKIHSFFGTLGKT